MAKLDWGKAPLRELDPARVQRMHAFVTPDRVIISVRDLTPAERKKLASRGKSRRKHVTRKAKAETKRKLAPKAKQQKAPLGAKDLAAQEFRRKEKIAAAEVCERKKFAAAEVYREEKAEHERRYLAKAARRTASMVAIKKSHLQAWVEKQTGLQTGRTLLQRLWRARLLRRDDSE